MIVPHPHVGRIPVRPSQLRQPKVGRANKAPVVAGATQIRAVDQTFLLGVRPQVATDGLNVGHGRLDPVSEGKSHVKQEYGACAGAGPVLNVTLVIIADAKAECPSRHRPIECFVTRVEVHHTFMLHRAIIQTSESPSAAVTASGEEQQG